ncbi:ATP-binding cassette domain-containing protein [Micromonospora sp. CA-259024]|uniref:ATP-binding cassette domain-containing protein n=1 Tax=Micromonospora sp. CA-259024 TaxID=3239965 RepID=UPI003D8D7999
MSCCDSWRLRWAFLPCAPRNLSKRYGRLLALDDLTLDVAAGEVFGFLGPNGAGKSTTIRLLLGLARPTSGRAWIFRRRRRPPQARLRAGGCRAMATDDRRRGAGPARPHRSRYGHRVPRRAHPTIRAGCPNRPAPTRRATGRGLL